MLARLNPGRLAAPRGTRPVAVALLSAAMLGGALTACGNSPVLQRIKYCESGNNYRAVNSSSGAAGAYQMMYTTWHALPESRGYRTAADAPAYVQDAAARRLYAMYGTSPWAASRSCWG